MPDASPFWQNAFLVGVFVVIGWGVWSGWREGVVRAGFRLVALLGGGFVGLAVGGAVAPIVTMLLPVPAPLVAVAVGLVVALAIYALAWIISALLFKRTGQQPSAILRLFFGAGGGLLGAFIGLTVVWAGLLFVRGLGGFYEGMLEAGRDALVAPGGAGVALVKLKRSIEAGGPAAQVVALDVVPAEYYRIGQKLGRVSAEPAALHRLLSYPPIQALLADPKLAAVTSDPAAYDAVRTQSLAALFANRGLLAALNDPALIARAQKIDIEAALDYALADPAPPAAKPSP